MYITLQMHVRYGTVFQLGQQASLGHAGSRAMGSESL
jgi:hypothetical protein